MSLALTPYALIGPQSRRNEFLAHSKAPEPAYFGELPPTRHEFPRYRMMIDLALDDAPERIRLYAYRTGQVVIGCAVKKSLAEMVYQAGVPVQGHLIGINSLPTFLARPTWEVSAYAKEGGEVLTALQDWLGIELTRAPDQVGMITPRTLFMIINEAYEVMQEGTATEEDIDLAMRLGTNYPEGPIAWSREIGLENIVSVIENLRKTTGQGRYRVSPLLKERMWKGM
ncbi:MAG: 3-hydroxyacyl-CoA dehydrogenase family protein [Bacteroidota bacterium]